MQLIYQKIYNLFNNPTNQQMFIDKGFEPICTIDKFRGQTTNPEQFEYFPTPALFISSKTTWSLQGKTYEGKINIDFHLVQEQPSDTSNFSTNFAEGLKQLHYFNLVQQFLDGLETTETSKLIRTANTDIDTGAFCYSLLSYTCTTYSGNTNNNTILKDDVQVEIVGKRLEKHL